MNTPHSTPFFALAVLLAATSPATVSVEAAPATTAPAAKLSPAPLGVGMVANTANTITLEWLAPTTTDVTGYNVYISRTQDGVFSHFATITETSITHANLAPGATHYYKVSALRGESESALSPAAPAFTVDSWQPRPFPATIAKNMCLTLGAAVVSDSKPLKGELAHLTDGSDATSCRLRKGSEIKIQLNPDAYIADAAYLMVHFRTDCGPADWSNDKQKRTLRNYVLLESHDSTNGTDGTWREIVSGVNEHLDGVIVIPNHKPKWIGLRSTYASEADIPKPGDRRLMPGDLILARLEVFRSAPAGQRNDYWIFTGDSLVVQDMPAAADPGRKAWFSDLVRLRHPDRYPIVVHAARGGEMLKDTLPRMRRTLPELSPDNRTQTPTATILCWETGYNDVGVGGSVGSGGNLIPLYESALRLCQETGLILVPARIQFSLQYLNRETLRPAKDGVFVNTLAINLGGVDVFARTSTPYACDPTTQLPYADYWTYTRAHHATALVKDGVHHTKEGSDGINQLWADVADRMIYSPQKSAPTATSAR